MALYRGITPQEGSRSHTHLIKSGHGAPAGDFVLDNSFKKKELESVFPKGVLFTYQFGGPGMEDVTIPQGRLVGVCKSQMRFYDGITKTPITLPGMALNNNVVGMVPYNITKDWLEEDQFGGNKPSFITTEYVVLPYMPGFTPNTNYNIQGVVAEELEISKKNNMPWGSLIGKAQEGDYVKATPSGRCTKWNKDSDHFIDVVGQILEMDLNQEAWGWEKWVLWDSSSVTEDDNYINKSGVSNLPTDGGYPYDPQYVEGRLDDANSIQSEYTYNPTGLMGLHDGWGNYENFGRNDTVFEKMEIGETPSSVNEDMHLVFNVVTYDGVKAKNIVPDSVTVYIDDQEVSEENVTVDEIPGLIIISGLQSSQAGKKVTATYKLNHFGTPSYLDFKGVVGSASILLKK